MPRPAKQESKALSVGSPEATARSLGLRRGLEILCLFSDERPAWGVSDIAREIGVQKSQVHRALKTMEDMGFLRKDARSRKYVMGLRALVVGATAGRLTSSLPGARRLLRQLSDEISATVSFRLIDGDDLLIVDWYEGHETLPAHWPVGMRVPFNFGAGGKIFAATLPDERVDHLIETFGLPRYTEQTITDRSLFLEELKRVRQQGYASSDGENIAGSFSVAAPVLGKDGALKAVVVGSRPSRQLSEDMRKTFIRAVQQTAENISRLAQAEPAVRLDRPLADLQLV